MVESLSTTVDVDPEAAVDSVRRKFLDASAKEEWDHDFVVDHDAIGALVDAIKESEQIPDEARIERTVIDGAGEIDVWYTTEDN